MHGDTSLQNLNILCRRPARMLDSKMFTNEGRIKLGRDHLLYPSAAHLCSNYNVTDGGAAANAPYGNQCWFP